MGSRNRQGLRIGSVRLYQTGKSEIDYYHIWRWIHVFWLN